MGARARTWWARQTMKAKRQRKLDGLKWVEAAEPPPFAVGPRRLKGMAAKGKAYERKVGTLLTKALASGDLSGDLWLGPWFRFEDTAGKGLAQPDALLILDDRIIIFEAKLKQTIAALPQIRLYGELASTLLGKPWVGVQIFRWPSTLRQNDPKLLAAIQDIVSVEGTHTIFNHHWLGG